jgi:hypothetical protein
MSEAEAEGKREKAITLMERVGGDADKFRDMSAAEYAASKNAQLLNPAHRGRIVTKADLDSLVDELQDGLEEALDPELTREELVSKVKELANLASGEEDSDSDDDE